MNHPPRESIKEKLDNVSIVECDLWAELIAEHPELENLTKAALYFYDTNDPQAY